MTTLFLVRHGRSTANSSGILAGRAPGVCLDDTGRAQAAAAGVRLAGVELAAAYTSPIERCRQTTELLLAGREVPVTVDERLAECDYGQWTNRPLGELADEPLWRTVQDQPSAARFPGGESLPELWARATCCVRDLEAHVRAAHGEDACWVIVSHGDVIKAIVADALGLHLDAFQRIMVDPASVQVIRHTARRPYLVALNTTSGDLAERVPRPRTGDDAVVGGTA